MPFPSLRRCLLTVPFALAAVAAVPAEAGPFSSLVVFGDSLSDNGNNFAAGLFDPTQVITGNSYVPSFTYASHVYSNGPVWASDFAAKIGVSLTPSATGGTDYAYGGATTGPNPSAFPFSLLTQTSAYLTATGNVASADALYVVAGGGNNARAALLAIGGGADIGTTITAAAASFAADVGSMVDQLQAAGAKHIVVWDTPNLGTAPAVVAGGAAALGSFLASSMNSALALRLTGEAGVSTFDIFGLGTSLAANPAAFGFTNTTDACGAVLNADCSKYVYWDGIHPTAAGHEAIADAMFAFAVPVPEPETWALLVAGLAAIGWTSKRRQTALPKRG
jgi:outer membrane lipase/esterase